MIGSLARLGGINLGNIAGNAVNNLFGNSQAGNLAGSVAQGLTSFLSGDPIGAFQAVKNAFSSIASTFNRGGGNAGMFGGGPQMGGVATGRLPMLPQMGGGFGTGQMGGLGGMNFGNVGGGFNGAIGGASANQTLGAASSALNQMGNLKAKMQGITNNPNMSSEQKQAAMMQLQQEMQMVQQLLQMISTMMKKSHDISMAIIGNMR